MIQTQFFRSGKLDIIQNELNEYIEEYEIIGDQIICIQYNTVYQPTQLTVLNTIMLVYEEEGRDAWEDREEEDEEEKKEDSIDGLHDG